MERPRLYRTMSHTIQRMGDLTATTPGPINPATNPYNFLKYLHIAPKFWIYSRLENSNSNTPLNSLWMEIHNFVVSWGDTGGKVKQHKVTLQSCAPHVVFRAFSKNELL